jgi:hypothetical protein
MRVILLVTAILFLVLTNGCLSNTENNKTDYLVVANSVADQACGYLNPQGDTIIPFNKYLACFTDTFKTSAIVANSKTIVAIDRQEKVLYEVFLYDNGPDYPAEGLFRIVQNNKIGFADALTGKIVIQPQFTCAYPFEGGKAKVSNNCTIKPEGEHSLWISDTWDYIDKTGKVLSPHQ